jgi:hypothetical protein
VHVPELEGWLIETDRAVMVVLDDLAGVPVTVKHPPTATALCVTVSVWENVVDEVVLTVVCPALALWTSMEVPVIDATLPLADPPGLGGVDAAPAVDDRAATAATASMTAPAGPPHRRSPRWPRCDLTIGLIVRSGIA